MIGTRYAGKRNKFKLLLSEYKMKEFKPQSMNSAKRSCQVNNRPTCPFTYGDPRRRCMCGHVTDSFVGEGSHEDSNGALYAIHFLRV